MEARIVISDSKQIEAKEKDFRKAAASGDLELVKKLFSEGVDINSIGPDTKKTALHRAAEFARPKIIEFLISKKANIDSKDNQGNTSLNCAIQTKLGKLIDRINSIDRLIDAHANPLEPNIEGNTPFMNFHLIRDDKELSTKIHLCNQVRLITRKIKEYVAETAVKKGMSARIRPNGEVIFGDAQELLRNEKSSDIPASGQISITAIDPSSSQPFKLAPHR